MSKDYKIAIRDKRLEAGNLMTSDQIAKCNVAIHLAAVASGAAGVIPIPVADAIPISAAQITMVIALGEIFDQKISSEVAKSLVSAAASTLVGRSLFKLVPIVGWIASASIAAGVTEAIGWTVAVDMADNYRTKWKQQRAARDAANAYAEADYYRRMHYDFDTSTVDFSHC